MADVRGLFIPNTSPYFSMFRAGCLDIPYKDCIRECERLGIPLRTKDKQAWDDGQWKWKMKNQSSILNPVVRPPTSSTKIISHDMKLEEFDVWPQGWSGTPRRWFPADESGSMPLIRWGYKDGFVPELYDRDTAIAIAPNGMVGQNLYAQPFIVIDIDGVGHGEEDPQVIEFGRQFSSYTETWENPEKKGSFHLYFATDRRIPIAHYNYAKLDLMGNATNAAVYTKRKKSNGIPRAPLTEEVWSLLKAYLNTRRKEITNGQQDTKEDIWP